MNSRRHDQRRTGALITLLAVLLGGFAISSQDSAPASAAAPPADESRHRFDQAVVMLHARQYEYAVAALQRLLVLSPHLAEAHLNMGFALLGLKRTQEARVFFDSATALKRDLAGAYYGLALAFEAEGDLALATGAMRSYLHLAREERPEHLSRARAALWEWEQARGAAGARR